MKRLLITSLIISLFFSIIGVQAEGLLPSLTETIGKPMPSFSDALNCYPDDEISNEDGSTTEMYLNVSDEMFTTFSVYLERIGATIQKYDVDNEVLSATILFNETAFSFQYDARKSTVLVNYPKGTYNEKVKQAYTHFSEAQRLLEEGTEDAAWNEILLIPQYHIFPPVVSLLENNDSLLKTACRIKFAPFREVGNVVTFGHYEQDNNTENGKENIEWFVLDYDKSKDKSLLLSVYALDAKPFNIVQADITWEKSSLRGWLNTQFLETAFSSEELSAIIMTEVDNSASQGVKEWHTKGSNNTQDQIFLLSFHEANEYLGLINDDGEWSYNPIPIAKSTAYAQSQGEREGWSTSEEVRWWLRSPGDEPGFIADVYYNGSLRNNSALDGTYGIGYVRPAIWVNLEAAVY